MHQTSFAKINLATGYKSRLATQTQAQKSLFRCEHCPEASINSSKRTKFVLVFVAFASARYFTRRQTLMLTLAVMLLVNTRHKSYRGELDIIQ